MGPNPPFTSFLVTIPGFRESDGPASCSTPGMDRHGSFAALLDFELPEAGLPLGLGTRNYERLWHRNTRELRVLTCLLFVVVDLPRVPPFVGIQFSRRADMPASEYRIMSYGTSLSISFRSVHILQGGGCRLKIYAYLSTS